MFAAKRDTDAGYHLEAQMAMTGDVIESQQSINEYLYLPTGPRANNGRFGERTLPWTDLQVIILQ